MVNFLQSLDTGLLYQHIPSSFTSIYYTVQHVLRVQKFWSAFVCEKDISKFNWSVYENETERILLELKTQSAEMANSFSVFSEEELHQPLKLNMPWAKNELSRYEYIMHVVNYSTFHRGQVVTMLVDWAFREIFRRQIIIFLIVSNPTQVNKFVYLNEQMSIFLFTFTKYCKQN